MKEDAGRGYRRVVASPLPRRIVEIDQVKALWDSAIVVTCGGGGIPVVENDDGTLTVSYATAAPAGVTVSGAVTTGADGDATIELIADGNVVATATASGKTGNYALENVAAGTYTLKVSQLNHVAREYTITVASEDVAQDVKIHLIGDIDGNGKINMGDVSKLNAHLKGTNVITDEYMVLCANVNGGKLNMGDTASLYSHIKGTKLLY